MSCNPGRAGCSYRWRRYPGRGHRRLLTRIKRERVPAPLIVSALQRVRLPQPADEISELPLVVLYGRNRYIHKTFHHAQIRGLRNVWLALH
jgi:hypothetical protein